MTNYDNLTEEEQLEKVKKNGFSIQFISKPSLQVQLEAVRESVGAIRHIKNPSFQVQKEVLKINPTCAYYLKNKYGFVFDKSLVA